MVKFETNPEHPMTQLFNLVMVPSKEDPYAFNLEQYVEIASEVGVYQGMTREGDFVLYPAVVLDKMPRYPEHKNKLEWMNVPRLERKRPVLIKTSGFTMIPKSSEHVNYILNYFSDDDLDYII